MRALAREVAFKKIYESLFISNDDMDNLFDIENLTNKEGQQFANTLVELFFQNKVEIEETIKANLKNYELDRVYKIDRAIISLAITEHFYFKQTPKAVIINEAVDLAKRYGTDKSYSFVNGILSVVLKDDNGN